MPPYNTNLHIVTWLKGVLPYLCNEFGVVPTIRKLSEMKGCSYASMQKAIKKLEEEELLVSKRGFGTCLRNSKMLPKLEPKKDIQVIINNIQTDKSKPLIVVILPVYNDNKAHHNLIYDYLSDFCVGVIDVFDKLNIEVVFKYFDTNEINTNKSIRSILTFLKKNQVKGVMTVSITDHFFFKSIYKIGLPYLVVDHWPFGEDIPSLNPNHSSATKELVCVLASLKHKNIALMDRKNPKFNPELANGYKAGLLATNLEFREDLLFNLTSGFFGKEESMKKFEKFFTGDNRPTAIISYSSEVAIELVKILIRFGLNVPRDISIVTFCSSKVVFNDLHLSGIFYDWHRIGAHSANKLLSIVNKKENIIYDEYFNFSFWNGNTISHNSFKPSAAKAL